MLGKRHDLLCIDPSGWSKMEPPEQGVTRKTGVAAHPAFDLSLLNLRLPDHPAENRALQDSPPFSKKSLTRLQVWN